MKSLQSLIPAPKFNGKIIIRDFGLTNPREGLLADESYERLVILCFLQRSLAAPNSISVVANIVIWIE